MEPPEIPDRNARVPTLWIIVGIVASAVLLYVLWRLLNYYIAPEDNPTQRKDVVQAFAVIVGGLVATGTLLIGWRNLRHNQRALLVNLRYTDKTLRNAQEVENRRAQGSSLQAYFEQMEDLLLDKKLRQARPGAEVRILAQAQTHTVLPTLNADRKRSIVLFLYKSMLLQNPKPIIELLGADLRGVDLNKAHLPGINLQEADLQDANLAGADLQNANLQDANLAGADLQEANLQDANLVRANLVRANLLKADLQDAYLGRANLGGADLQNANAYGADLQNANLQDANLGYATLTIVKAKLSPEQLKQVKRP